MAFWHFRQNNSYGIFDENDVVQINVIIEGKDADDARQRFEKVIGSYSQSGDCPCCGDRWSSWYAENSDGQSVPLVYGESILLYENADEVSESVALTKGKKLSMDINTVVYYLDGIKSFGLAPSLW